ncbi:MAG: hypothetical protein GXP48_11665 [Acidobacteria bacterium]|nr:hypothetical protein [Acidobacteriota bacterium]
MQLLIIILHHEEVLDDVLSTLVEYGYQDSIVLESQTALGLLERDLPIFAGVRALVPGGLDFCRTVLCGVEDDAAVDEVIGGLAGLNIPNVAGEPATTVFVIPVRTMFQLE